MKRIAVVGLGNILMGDDGIGVRIIQELAVTRALPKNVSLVQAETAGISILPQLDGMEAIILVDAVEFEGDYGEVRTFLDREIEIGRATPVSMHEVGMKDLVSLMILQSQSVPQISLVGIKPKNIELVPELSPEVMSGIARAVKVVLDEVDRMNSQTT